MPGCCVPVLCAAVGHSTRCHRRPGRVLCRCCAGVCAAVVPRAIMAVAAVATLVAAAAAQGAVAQHSLRAEATEFYADPTSGNNNNAGLTPQAPWRSLDRGQPTQMRKTAVTGATTLSVARAVQLPDAGHVGIVFGAHTPPGIRLHYSSRDAFTLFGVTCAANTTTASSCVVVPAMPAGAMVYSEEWPRPPRGSTLYAGPGVYAFPPNATTAFQLELASYDAAYFMSTGLRVQGTVSSSGRPLSVIDGRSLSRTAVTVAGASDVMLSGFDIRRGSVYASQADGFTLTRSRVHHATTGVSIGYSQNVSVTHNLIFDNSDGARADGIAIHRGTDWAVIAHNTISNSDYCVHVFPGSATDVTRSITIVGNVMTRCTDAAGLVVEPGVQLSTVGRNNIWLTGKGGGLKELNAHALGSQLNQWYTGLNQSEAFRTTPPDDLHEDPQIVSWDEASPAFLCSAAASVTARAGIGACAHAAPAPDGGWQGVLNSDFSAGMWSWQGHTFPANPDATGRPVWHPQSATWSVSDDGCAVNRAPCAKLQTTQQVNGSTANTRLRSAAFDVQQGGGMNFSLGVSVKGDTSSARVSACVTVVDWDVS